MKTKIFLSLIFFFFLALASSVPDAHGQTCPGSCKDACLDSGEVAIQSTSCASGTRCCIASRGAAGLVPCGNGSNYADRCTLCHLVLGFQVLISYGFWIVVFLAFLMLVVAGVMYVMSSGSDEMIKTAKGIMKNTLYGFGFVLAAWLIINYALVILGARDDNNDGIPDFGITEAEDGWFNFTCVVPPA